MEWILVVFSTAEMEIATTVCLERALPFEFVCVRNLADAREAVMQRGRPRLIVASLSPPPTAEHAVPVDHAAPTGLAFLRDVRGRGTEPPCIFIDPVPSLDHQQMLLGMPGTIQMCTEAMREHLAAQAQELVFGKVPPPGQQQRLLDVDIVLNQNMCYWTLTRTKGVGATESGHFKLPEKRLRQLVLHSKLVGKLPQDETQETREFIRELGREMYRCIAAEQPVSNNLWEAVSRHTDRMKLLEKARFRFHVDVLTNQLLVEALSREDEEAPDIENYWLLQTPFLRRFGETGDRLALFKDQRSRKGPVQCLIILGNPSKFAAPAPLESIYQPIRQAADEAAWLHQYLAENQAAFRLAPPVILRYSEHARGSFGQVVRNALADGKWQMVHYSGHSDIDKNDTGYLVMGDHKDDLMDIEEFARQCRYAQFVFLNSCRSANVSFIRRSVAFNIPAVAGYAWPIRDDIAAEFSRKFYVNLFGSENLPNRFLEYAFMRARCHLHRQYPSDTFWSSPLLFMQSLDAERESDRMTVAGSVS